MNFDELKIEPCARVIPCGTTGGDTQGIGNTDCTDPNYRATHLGQCGDDARCSDPVFAAENPTLCLNSPRLILKPSTAVVEILKEAQYKAFFWINGQETELTDGVLYSVTDVAIALIGASSGNAIGVSVGTVTVVANYGGMQASASLTVIASGACADQAQHYLLLADVSKSSSGIFGGGYGTRLDVAESVGQSFVNHLNLVRDDAAVMRFDTTPTPIQAFTQNAAALIAAVQSLSSTVQHTDISTALLAAQQYFVDQGITGNRVIILFTDCENNQGTDPLATAEAIRQNGIVLIVIGLRAKGNAFRLAEHMASGGFFVNALPSNVAQVADWLNGMKSYLCSGNCTPEGDITVGIGLLNFNSFIHWDVTANEVDLIGKNDGGTPVYDLMPGNGLYLDDHGSGPGFFGEITSKTNFNFIVGQTYKLSLYIAGNQRQSSSRSTRVRLGSFLDHTVSRTYGEGFTLAEWSFTVGAPTSGKIKINGLENAGTEQSYGNLIDRVRLENTTTPTVMLYDDFDGENLTYIPPCQGAEYGYDCGNDCLDAPIPAQSGDSSPLPNLENEVAAAIYHGVSEASVFCADDPTITVTRVGTANSDISQAEADLLAYQAAKALAEADLVC